METALKLTQLPWTTALWISSGYAGYFIAHLGIRSHHKGADVTFGTFVFGFFGLFSYLAAMSWYGLHSLAASAAGFLSSVLIGAMWATWGRRAVRFLLRSSRVSLADDLPTAWAALGMDTSSVCCQMDVKTLDGTIYHTSDMSVFAKSPNGPCVLGANGDVLMYATDVFYPGDEDFTKMPNVRNKMWGDQITYIPASQILRIEVRRKPEKSIFLRCQRKWKLLFLRWRRGRGS